MAPEDTLESISNFIWEELTRASTDGASEFRHAQLATSGSQGWPQVRTIILRHADPERREIGFHTDRRSAKMSELAAEPAVSVVAYDRPRGMQMRIWGQAAVHVNDTRSHSAWAALYPPLRVPYRTPFISGQPLDNPDLADPSDAARNPTDPNAGQTNFAVVAIRVARVEWLHLRPTGHRRTRFEWNSMWEGRWLAP